LSGIYEGFASFLSGSVREKDAVVSFDKFVCLLKNCIIFRVSKIWRIALRKISLSLALIVYGIIEDDEEWRFIRLMMFEDKEGDKWKIELRYGEDRYKEVVAS